MRFIKKAAPNLSQEFKVYVPSKRLQLCEQKRMLAKQLHDFLHIYRKDTSQLRIDISAQLEQERRHYKHKMIDEKAFQTLLYKCCEAELEEIMSVYMRNFQDSSVFLGTSKNLPTNPDPISFGLNSSTSNHSNQSSAISKSNSETDHYNAPYPPPTKVIESSQTKQNTNLVPDSYSQSNLSIERSLFSSSNTIFRKARPQIESLNFDYDLEETKKHEIKKKSRRKIKGALKAKEKLFKKTSGDDLSDVSCDSVFSISSRSDRESLSRSDSPNLSRSQKRHKKKLNQLRDRSIINHLYQKPLALKNSKAVTKTVENNSNDMTHVNLGSSQGSIKRDVGNEPVNKIKLDKLEEHRRNKNAGKRHESENATTNIYSDAKSNRSKVKPSSFSNNNLVSLNLPPELSNGTTKNGLYLS